MFKYLAVPTLLCAFSCAHAQDPSEPCVAALLVDERIQILAPKMPLDMTRGQSLDILSNKSKPTAEEKAALSIFVTEGEKCLDAGNDWRKANYPPEFIAIITTYRVDLVAAFADLYGGSTTYGDLARTRAKLAADVKNKTDIVVRNLLGQRAADEKRQQELAAIKSQEERRIQAQRDADERQRQFAQQQQMQQQEESRRQAALQYLMNQQPFQPYMLPMPKPATNCTGQWVGNQWQSVCR